MADLRLAEILTALSQVTDLGMGQPPETAIRTCLLATGLARQLGLPECEVADVYYTALLQHIGCTAYAHETAAIAGGDDIGFRAAGARVDDASLRDTLAFMLTGVASSAPPPTRIRAVLDVMRAGPSFPKRLYRANCEVAVRTVDRLGLPPGVQRGLDTIYARWDGTGTPATKGNDIALPSRFAQVAGQAMVFVQAGEQDRAIEAIRHRAGTALDPTIANALVTHGPDMLAAIDATDPALAVLEAEPEPRRRIAASHLERLARAFADVTDLKSPWLHGHSTGVARLARAAARQMALPDDEARRIEIAGYLHDIGRVGVPSGIWDKPTTLTTAEWERVRLHPYHAERILSCSPTLADIAPLAGMHHERLDGSGYHRGASGSTIPVGARILAAADAYDAMTHDRPYRAARPAEEAAAALQAEARAGRHDPSAVHAVLTAAGHRSRSPRHAWPAGLTDREVEVLRLAARGLSNKQIGATLSISPKTADHHIQHIYDKIGVSTRAGAALYAMEHDLLPEGTSREMG